MNLSKIPSKFCEAKTKANKLVEMLHRSRMVHQAAISNLNKECLRLRAEALSASEQIEMKVKTNSTIRDKLELKSKLVSKLELELKYAQTREIILEIKIRERSEEDATTQKVISDFKKQIRESNRLLKEVREDMESAQRILLNERLKHKEIQVKAEKLYIDNIRTKASISATEHLRAQDKKRIDKLTLEWKTMLKEQMRRSEKEQDYMKHIFEGWKSAILTAYELKMSKLQDKIDRLEQGEVQFENRLSSMQAEMESLREELSNQIMINGGFKTSIQLLRSQKNILRKKLDIKLKLMPQKRQSTNRWFYDDSIAQIRRLLNTEYNDDISNYYGRHFTNGKLITSQADVPSLDLRVKSPIAGTKRALEENTNTGGGKRRKPTSVKSRGRPFLNKKAASIISLKTNTLNSDMRTEPLPNAKLSIKQESKKF